MANQLIYGFGQPDFLTKAEGNLASKMIFVEPFAIEVSGSSNKVQSRKQLDGIKVIAGSKITEEIFTAKITIEATSWMAMQLAYGELEQTSTNLPLSFVKQGIPVLDAATGAILDPELTSVVPIGATSPVWVYDLTNERSLTQIATGAPGIYEFRVDVVTGKILLNPLSIGKNYAYRFVLLTGAKNTLGYGNTPTVLDNFSFSALVKADERDYKLVIPSMTRSSSPSLQLGDLTKLEIEYDLLVESGQRKPYYLIKL